MSPVHRDHSADTAVDVMQHLPPSGSAAARGLASGFSAGHTLPVRVELRRQLQRRRTQLALAFMVLLPIILVIAFAFDSGEPDGGSRETTSPGSSFVDLAKQGATNFAIVAMFFAASFLLVVVVSLFFGDTVASEASWSSLRYLLAMPVPRNRLLRQKFLVAALLSLVAVVLLPVAAWVLGAIVYGTGPVTTPLGLTFGGWSALGRLAIVVGYVAISLLWVAGLAFLLSVCTDAPLGAVGGSVLLAILSQILNQIEALGGIRDWLPTHYAFAWTGAMIDPIRWDDMVRGSFTSLLYGTIFTALAFWRFHRKDITS